MTAEVCGDNDERRDAGQTQGQASVALAGAAYFSWKYQGVCLRGLLTDSSNSGTLPSI